MKQHTLTSAVAVFIALTVPNVTLAQSGPTNFPMVGITGAQTLHLNLVAFPPDPCLTVNLGFQNRNGVAVGPSQTVSLQQGQSVSLALNGNSLVGADQRVELLPTVAGFDGAATGASCVASVEVINNANGVTRVLVPGAVGYPPTPGLWHAGRDVCSDGAFERGGVSSRSVHGNNQLERQEWNPDRNVPSS